MGKNMERRNQGTRLGEVQQRNTPQTAEEIADRRLGIALCVSCIDFWLVVALIFIRWLR